MYEFDNEVVLGLVREHGRFEPVRVIGAGAMGTVLQVKDPRMRRIRAMKIINPMFTDEPVIKARFMDEAAVMDSIVHKNIVRVYEVGELEDDHSKFLYIVLEWVDGGSLADHCEAYGAMPARQAVQVALAICDGLAVAHEEGIIHRDIKPDNILLDKKGRPKVADFGIASVRSGDGDRRRTSTEATLGSLGFMAPEQFGKAANVDARSDIHALAMTLWNMLAGKRPPTEPSWYHDVHHNDRYMQGIPAELVCIIRKAVMMRPEQRYQNVQELAGDLRSVMGQLPEDPVETPALGSVPDMVVESTGLLVAADLAKDAAEWADSYDSEPDVIVGGSASQPGSGFHEPVKPGTHAYAPQKGAVRTGSEPDVDNNSATLQTPPGFVVSVPLDIGTLHEGNGEFGSSQIPFRRGLKGPVAIVASIVTVLMVVFFIVNSDTTDVESTGKGLASNPPTPATVGQRRSVDDSAERQPMAPIATTSTPVVSPRLAEAEMRVERPSVEPASVVQSLPVVQSENIKPSNGKGNQRGKRRGKRKQPERIAMVPEVVAPVVEQVRVSLDLPSGDPAKVWLVGNGGRFQLPHRVKPGTYKVVAQFKDRDSEIVIPNLQVNSGSSPSIRCNSAFARCKAH